MPERPAIRVVPVDLELPPALLRLRRYLRAGFHDSGELYHGGHSGPQRLLLRAPS